MISRRRFLATLSAAFAALAIIALGAAAFVWSGVYDVGADDAHTRAVEATIERLRERSVAARARDIAAPADLDDPKRVAAGASHYAEMCVGCHLAPGVTQSELRDGLYPRPPSFIESAQRDPRTMFWTIKHGIKMSGMPAWGKSHDDEAIWNMVAFVQKVPGMSVKDYQVLTGEAEVQAEDAKRVNESGMRPGHDQESQEGPRRKAKSHGHHDHRH